MTTVLYILPVHNEAAVLRRNVERLCTRLSSEAGTSVLLVENGSVDRSWDVTREIAGEHGPVPVLAFQEPSAGLGYAYDRGLREALASHGQSANHFAVLTAADLPFGFSDLDAAWPHLESGEHRALMGSKANPGSTGPRNPKRWAMSLVYRAVRRIAVGMKVGDSQGSVFIRLDLAAELVPLIRSRDFFYTTELCYFAERAGEHILELPIAIEGEQRKSTVRPFRDGTRMARQLLELRRRR